MFRLVQSNDMQVLARKFCEQSQQFADPFVPTTVVVQSFGIGQWLKLQLAKQQGVSANLDCILPGHYIWRLYRELLTDQLLPDESPFDRERLGWRLMKLIPGIHHEPLQQYLSAPGDPYIRLYQLSYQIAQLYDQYLIYRPEWLLNWERGNPSLPLAPQHIWQMSLWQQIVEDAPDIQGQHRANLHQQLLAAIAEKSLVTDSPGCPSESDSDNGSGSATTISIFGLTSIAPMQLETFSALSNIMDINVYFLNPCQHYWGDIVSPRDKARRSVRAMLGKLSKDRHGGVSGDESDSRRAFSRTNGHPLSGSKQSSGMIIDDGSCLMRELEDQDYLMVGNPLLGSLGKQGREYLDLLLENDSVRTIEFDLFRENDSNSLLDMVKNHILNLEDGVESGEMLVLDCADHSIQVHSTHSRMREVEILLDQLLRMFDKHDDIEPKDVIVMTPDISLYAPFLTAVFKDKIHYGVADRTLIQQSTLVASFFKIIALPAARLTSVEVMDLLEVPAVQKRFDLNEEALNRISTWINETGIRWEFDGAGKKRWGLPEDNVNTWRFGLDRLLLGYAMQPEDGMYAGVLPFDVQGDSGELLGKLCHIVELLMRTRDELTHPHTASEWSTLLHRILQDFFDPVEAETLEITQLQTVIDQMERDTASAGYEERFSNQLMRFWLEQQLSPGHQSPGFITGGITFATLVPMRSIPFRVVCLLGMNDADFPREERPVSFDLMAINGARKGDRSRRTDDRYLFLEALLSAGDVFYISYEGKGNRDNQMRPPSTVVNELLEYVNSVFKPRLEVIEHPLQPFSKQYYDGKDKNLVSYQSTWFNALRPQEQVAFAQDGLEPPEELNVESMDQLTRFFRHPAAYFFQRGLGVYFDDRNVELKETETFEPDALEKYALSDLALKDLMNGRDEEQWRQRMFAEGKVLNNRLGNAHLDTQLAIARSIREELIKVVADEQPRSIHEILNLDGRKLSFSVPVLYTDWHIDIRPGQLRKRQLLEVWIRHLCLNAEGYELPTQTIAKGNNTATFNKTIIQPLSATDARELLVHLIQYYETGIRTPLHFMPECSFEFAHAIESGSPVNRALQKTEKYWKNDRPGSEGINPYWVRLVHGGEDLFDDNFQRIATEIYQPLITHWNGK